MNFSWADKQDDKDFILAEDVNVLARGVKEAKAYADEQSKESIIKSTIRMEKYTDYTGFGMTETSEGTRMRIVVNASFFNDKIGVASPSDLKLSNYILLIKRKDLERYFTARILGYENRSDGNFTLRYEFNEYGISSGMEGFEYFNLVDEVYFCLMSEDAEKALKKYSDSRVEEAKSYANDKIESAVILSRNISDGAVTPEKTSFFTKIYGKNLYNRETVSLNKNFNSSGSLIDATNYYVTDFIPIEANKSITFYRLDRGVYVKNTMRYVIAYDNEQNVISSGIFQDIKTCTIPEGAKFVRASLYNSYYTKHDEMLPMICYGDADTQPQYEEYKEYSSIDAYFKSNNIVDFQDTFDKYFNQKHQIAVVPSACNSYNTATEFVEFPVNSDLNNVYSLYDGLIESYPNYVSKSLVGNVTVDGTELPIYRYDFTPPLINGSKMTDVCKVLLTNCTHGTEKFQISTTYRLMLDICENWRTCELLKTLRFNCHFTIIPIVNPYGFLNNTRKNENGIDLNRNFETDFVAGTDITSDSYSGTTANSEQSTQIINNLANTEYFDFMLDIHDFGNFSANNKVGYFTPCLKSPNTIGVCRAIALWANSKILTENTNIEDINASYFQSAEMSNFNGYLYSAFDNGVLIELMYGWGDDTLGTKETAQKIDVEILGGAILTMLNGYKCRYLNI